MEYPSSIKWPRVRADSMQLINGLFDDFSVKNKNSKSRAMTGCSPQSVDQVRAPSPLPDNLLLRLPAELRNKIYYQVLGGKILRFKSTFACRHARLDTKEPHALSLLYVCRQIHSETALLPYFLNTFSFNDLDISLYPFLRQRSPAQFRSIRSLELVTSKAMQMWSESRDFTLGMQEEMRLIGALPNLKYIRVLIDTVASRYFDASGSDYPDFNFTWESLRLLDKAIYHHRPDVIVTFKVVQDLGVGV